MTELSVLAMAVKPIFAAVILPAELAQLVQQWPTEWEACRLQGEGGGGGTPYKGLYWKAPPQRDAFFRLQVYDRVGISPAEVYEKVGKSVISVNKKANRCILWLWKSRENIMVLSFIPILKTVYLLQLKGMQSSGSKENHFYSFFFFFNIFIDNHIK